MRQGTTVQLRRRRAIQDSCLCVLRPCTCSWHTQAAASGAMPTLFAELSEGSASALRVMATLEFYSALIRPTTIMKIGGTTWTNELPPSFSISFGSLLLHEMSCLLTAARRERRRKLCAQAHVLWLQLERGRQGANLGCDWQRCCL